MRNFLFAFLGTVGLALLGLPIAVHESHRTGGAPQGLELAAPAQMVPVTAVTEANPVASAHSEDRDGDRDAQADRDDAAPNAAGNDKANEATDPQPANSHQGTSHQGQKSINVDLTDLVIRPV
jgi:hypothetical protein